MRRLVLLIGVITLDPDSYLSLAPGWEPTLPRHDETFRLRDLLVPV